MKNNYFNYLIIGMMCLSINTGPSQNILSFGDLAVTTEIIPFKIPPSSARNYDDTVISKKLEAATQDKVVIAGTFQSALNCASDWDPGCEYTQLTFNPSTGLYTGTFQIPAGNNRYKVTVGGSWDVNYGENGIPNGADIFLCVTSGSEEITFTYDPATNLVTTSPVTSGFSPDCLPLVVLAGNFQEELGCESDWLSDCSNTALTYNPGSGLFEGDLNIPAGCYQYRVVLENNWQISFGEDGIHNGINYILSIPEDPAITHFTYDPVSHIVNSSPYSDAPQDLTKVSLLGTLQDELGCVIDYDYECENPALLLNPATGVWEGSFTLPAGCYTYLVKEVFGCTIIIYGENGIEWGNVIPLHVPVDGEVTFSYDPQTHIISSTPYSGAPQEVTTVSLIGTLQDETGCNYDNDFGCDNPALLFNPDSGLWEGSFTLPSGCYFYRVKETFGCNIENIYGENGMEWGNEIQLFVPLDGEITFSYDPQTHIISSTPYSGVPQEITTVSLFGTLQNELGCVDDNDYNCDNPELLFNPATGAWEGSFTIPAGCYLFRVKEIFGCSFTNLYGENGNEWGDDIQLYIPAESEITFSYNPETHILSSTPYSGAPQEVSKVSLYGDLQDDLGCDNAYDFDCDQPELLFNSDTGLWEGSFTLSAGCYTYYVKETLGCIVSFYGENGTLGYNDIQLYVPTDAEITFTYNPETHIISSTPYSGVPQEVTKVSLIGSLQDELGCDYDYNYECDKPALLFNSDSGNWEGSFTLPSGCYTYRVKETSVCNETFYGEKGIEGGEEIQLYVPLEGEITFSYDPETHILSSAPYGGGTPEASTVSLYGNLQDELGCAYDYDYGCENPALSFNSISGLWEGSFTLPAGCYTYWVKETTVCNDVIVYGENGIVWGDEIELYVPLDGEITFSYDPKTHIMSLSPYSGFPRDVITISLIGNLQDELGCAIDFDFECDKPELLFNSISGAWEGSFTLPAGCYTYLVKETFACDVTYYGENGIEYGYGNQLFVPSDTEITFSYDPQTHIISSSPYNNISTIIQCPDNISVNNDPGVCGAIVSYPEIEVTADCGGEIPSIIQTGGLPSGSFFPVGITTNTFVLIKTTGEEISCSFDVVVTDTEPPLISNLNQNYEPLWPPNHKMVPVFIEYLVSDNCNITSTELSILSNEPENGHGDGNTTPDWEILDEHNVLLRAERSGKGNGREYYITIKVTDSSGNLTEQLVTVSVPRDRGKKGQDIFETDLSNDKYILYPNGADDIINLKGPKTTSNSPYVIYDMLGIVKMQGTIGNDLIEVNTLKAGIYILKFETDNEYVFKKFIKNE